MKLSAAVLTSLLVTGCMTMPRPNTASGQPEITLPNVSVECVRGLLLNTFIDDGFMVRASTDLQLVVGRPSRNAAANILLSTRFTGAPEERLTMTLIPQPDGATRIVASGQYVANQGTGFERTIQRQPTQMDQDQFDVAAMRLQMECTRP